MTLVDEQILGSQVPTFMWVPDYEISLGDEAAALYNECAKPTGNLLDPYQRLALEVAFALDARRVLVCFELAIILSRQNGKGEILLALELAWLFLFGEKLIIHSAHLFETSREHFLKLQMLIQLNPDFDSRVFQMKEGRGSEEIILKLYNPASGRWIARPGARCKFMTRKGGAGRGFTGGKLVLDEAMYLDASMMAAGLPTMATRREAQVVYAGSAGMKHSTQLAAVRRRGYAARRGREFGDPSLALLAWEAERAVYDEDGKLVAGDDPADPRTWAKVNPAIGRPNFGISLEYVRKEARAFGGFHTVAFGTERLGIGDWPADDDLWEVLDKATWDAACDEHSKIAAAGRVFAVDMDPETQVYTLGVSGVREDGRGHVETVDQAKGSGWIVGRLLDVFQKAGRKSPVVVLKSGPAGHVLGDLVDAKLSVHSPPETEYAQACAAIVQDFTDREVWHIGQASLRSAMGAAGKRENVKKGWQWDRDRAGQAPIVCATLGRWGVKTGLASTPRSKIW